MVMQRRAGTMGWSFAWKLLLGPWMAAVIALSYLWAQPLAAFRAPDAARIIFWHVPMAMLGLVWFWVGAVHALRYLFGGRRGDAQMDTQVVACCEVGLLCTVLATATGAVFAAVQWGTPWSWDPKQVNITILIAIYLAYFGLRMSVEAPELRARLSAVYAIFGAVATPLLMYVIPNLPQVAELHPPGDVISSGLDSKWRIIYWMSTAGFLGITLWTYHLRLRVQAVLAASAQAIESRDARTTAVRRPRDEPAAEGGGGA